MPSLFTLNPDGQIEYEPTEEELKELQENIENQVESEGSENGENVTGDLPTGNEVSSSEDGAEIDGEVSENSSVPLDLPFTDDGSLAVSLPIDVTTALLDSSPAPGSLGSSTLDYFDRLVSGLRGDYCYVAYRTDSNDSYSGFIIYSRSYDVNGSLVSFKNADTVEVWREGNYDRLTHYTHDSGVDMDVNIFDNSTTVYYTNAVSGHPILGGVSTPFLISPFLVVGLLTAFATVVLSKILGGRR